MPDTIGINLSTEPLCDDVDVVVLEIFRHARNERDPNSGCEQQADASKELACCVVAVPSGVVIDNVPEDDGIQERKDLVDRREHQDQYNEKPILFEISEKNFHNLGPFPSSQRGWLRHSENAAKPRSGEDGVIRPARPRFAELTII